MKLASARIERRFAGPPQSGNGGYSCGLIARYVHGPAEVTLRVPPPLDTELGVCKDDDERVVLMHGDRLVGEGHPATVSTSLPPPPDYDEAVVAAERTFDVSLHPLPQCFVCGPLREPGDGLRIHPGPVDVDDTDWSGLLAAAWVPDHGLADSSGRLRPEFVWAALDCPTAYACSTPAGMRIILLGRQAVAIHRQPETGSRLIVTARQTGQEGRKYFADSALYDAGGRLLAECHATWIEVSREVQQGLHK